jgi:acetyl-CoA C-acetyltransferase
MNKTAANTPVIIGLGFYQEHNENPLDSLEPYQLMIKAVRNAAADAGSDDILHQIDSISVQQGMWEYSNPAKLIAEELGCPAAKSILADLGVLQLTPLFDLCNAIAAGEQHLGVVTGGEAKFRDLRSKITQQPISNTQQPEATSAPDLHHTSQDPFASQLEADAGIFMPVELFAIIESALRFNKGLSIDEQRDYVAELYSSFSDISVSNPHAWKQESVSAKAIRDPVGKNSMLAFPYTKRHNTQWNVNQSVAIMVCSMEKAKELGLDSSSWIYPLSAVQSKHVVCLSQQKKLHSHPGTVLAGERALDLAGSKINDVNYADLYSCFPASVQSFALDLKLEEVCPWSVTGSMAFAGGPYNHAGLDGVARMAEVLRCDDNHEKSLGLVSNLSGIFGKQAIALFSNQANEDGYRFEDITSTVAAIDLPLDLDGDYVGPATVVGYTVVFNKDEMARGIAFCDTPKGARTVVTTLDQHIMQMMTEEEFVGRKVNVLENRVLDLLM